MKKNFAKVLSVILAFAIATSLCAFSLPVVSAADSLPDFVDNSESPYFPAIATMRAQLTFLMQPTSSSTLPILINLYQ